MKLKPMENEQKKLQVLFKSLNWTKTTNVMFNREQKSVWVKIRYRFSNLAAYFLGIGTLQTSITQ